MKKSINADKAENRFIKINFKRGGRHELPCMQKAYTAWASYYGEN